MLALFAVNSTARTRTVDRPTITRAFTVRDLASLVDFGRTDNEDQSPAVGLSPDGRVAALIARRPDLDRNTFNQSLVLISLKQARVVATYPISAQPVPWAFDIRGLQTANGNFVENRPAWSPDGRRIAFLVPGLGGSQIAVVDVTTGGTTVVTSAPGGATDMVWNSDSHGLTFTTRVGLADHERAIDREAMTGYHYDRRIAPMVGARPGVPGSLPTARLYIDIRQPVARAGGADASGGAAQIVSAVANAPALAAAVATADGNRALITPSDPTQWSSPSIVQARIQGVTVSCAAEVCRGRLINAWWSYKKVVYLRREGWGDSLTALYSWRPGTAPRRLFKSADVLIGCTVAPDTLICGREGSLRPRYLWAFDLRTHRNRILFAPNGPELSGHQWRVVRLRWLGAHNAQGYGDLVIPRASPPDAGYPLVVVQYRTRGFLRGAVGNEYPILPLADQGFAILSVEAPKYYPLLLGSRPRTIEEAMRLAQDNNNDRRQQQDNVERAVAMARLALPIDPARMAITGISDAASSAVFALVNSRLFSVVALGSTDVDRETLAMGGPALADEFHSLGYPSLATDNDAFYRPLSLSANVDRLNVPILFQLPEAEYLVGLSAYTRLAEADAAVDLYIYPDEHHMKSQPAHKLAVYNRNLAWLSFWLKGDATGVDQVEEGRWRALRDRGCQLPPERRLPAQLCAHASTLTSSEIRK